MSSRERAEPITSGTSLIGSCNKKSTVIVLILNPNHSSYISNRSEATEKVQDRRKW